MNTLKLREKIITLLRENFEQKSHVLAFWLGGSDANDESDEYSDLDLIFCVQDGQEESFLWEVQWFLASIGSLDYIENIDHREKKMSQTFHIVGTSEHLLIEIILVQQSIWMKFIQGHPSFKPKIIFDKANVITFESPEDTSLQWKILAQFAEQKNLMMESSRVIKYVQRNEYIEATNYYIKYVFLPLVSVLRIKHTPLLHDWWRIHISRHFPQEIVEKLEDLMRFNSIADISRNTTLARTWFWEIAQEIENNDTFI